MAIIDTSMATDYRDDMGHPPDADRRNVTMNVSLPETLRDFVQSRLADGFGSVSEYVRELIRRDRDQAESLRVEQALADSLVKETIDREVVRDALDGIRALRARVAASGGAMSLEDIRKAVDEGSGL